MSRRLVLLILAAVLLCLAAYPSWAQLTVNNPPPPVPGPDCAGGSSVTGWPAYGSPFSSHCGTGVSTGTINLGTVGLPAVYSGTGTLSSYTPGGDVSFSNPNYTVTSLRAGNITVPNVSDTVALLAAAQTFTGKTVNCANNTCTVRANLDLTGALAAANFPAMTGDVTNTAGSLATTVGSIGGKAISLANSFSTSGNFALTLTQTGATNVTLPTTGTLATQTYAQNAASTSGFTLGSTPITNNGATYGTIAGLTLSAPTITGAASFGAAPSYTTLTNAPLLGTDVSGHLQAITLGSNLSLTGTTLNAAGGGGGGSFTPPAANSLYVSTGSSTSASGLAPVNNSLIYASGGAWTTLGPTASSIPCWSSGSVLSPCSTGTIQSLLGYLTANQTITLGGDASGSGSTSITTTNVKVNGVAYPASPSVNTVPVVTSSNQITYETAAGLAGVSGFGNMLQQSSFALNVTGVTQLTGLPNCANAADACPKSYIDAAATGQPPHAPVVATATSALPGTPTYNNGAGTLTASSATTLTVDGVSIANGNRVGVIGQASGFQNGIYVATISGSPWVLTRAADFNTAASGNIATGATFFSTGGTANGSTSWSLSTTGTITVGTTALTFVQIAGSATYTADGTTILKTGLQFSAIPSGILDAIGSTRGSIVERGASAWTTITPGTSGFVLTSNGTGADPTWQAATGALSGLTAGQLIIAGSASSGTSSIAYSNTSSANKIAEMGSGGLLDPGMLPQATAAAFGAVKCGTNTTCAGGVISAAAGLDTVTTGIAAAGTTLASATDLTTTQNYVASGATCTTTANSCLNQAAVRIDPALMVAGQHVYITNEDPTFLLLVYPDTTGHTINNQAAGIGIAVQANQTALLIVKSSTALRTVP